MWEADFGAVDSTIAGTFEDREHIVVFRVEHDALRDGLDRRKASANTSQKIGEHNWRHQDVP